jgi:hypothetical protein
MQVRDEAPSEALRCVLSQFKRGSFKPWRIEAAQKSR